VPPHTPF